MSLFTGSFTGIDPEECEECTAPADEHTFGHYCQPNQGLCPCGSGVAAQTCCPVVAWLEKSVFEGPPFLVVFLQDVGQQVVLFWAMGHIHAEVFPHASRFGDGVVWVPGGHEGGYVGMVAA